MTDPDRRRQLLTAVDRAVRRGELRSALDLCRSMLAEAPRDAELRARVSTIESLLQPSEGLDAPTARPDQPRHPSSTPEQIAEELAEHGDYAGAIAVFERLLAERPNHLLAQERCAELRALLGIRSAARSATPPPVPGRSRADLLMALLKRVETRRR